MPTADEFREELFRMMHAAFKQHGHVDINAGELHRRLGDYPGPNHRMPVCCEVMKAAMAEDAGDRILEQPERGEGASLTIRYVLPRPA
ncbi:MAG: HNH endonuclease [Acidobacteriia bacterium]|nr:HNH endonuclease [Terriglobia bacterium]